MDALKAPFPWYGGKSRAAALINARFGALRAYTEPFAGSLAVLLSRDPVVAECVNDADGYICNVWRAIAWAPGEVAHHANWPVSELDIHARHSVIIQAREGLTERMRSDPEHYDAKLAGWWLHGICAWIGGGYGAAASLRKPHLHNSRGIHAMAAPDLSALSARLRRVRVCCGDWTRVLGPSCFGDVEPGRTGILLDPPYMGAEGVYAEGNAVAREAYEWAVDHPEYRIAYCCYAGDLPCPDGWTESSWTSKLSTRRGLGAHERIFFSPTCERQGSLF